MKTYLSLVMQCEDCHYSQHVLLGKDKVVRHECNQGNVRHKVPELKDVMGIRRKL